MLRTGCYAHCVAAVRDGDRPVVLAMPATMVRWGLAPASILATTSPVAFTLDAGELAETLDAEGLSRVADAMRAPTPTGHLRVLAECANGWARLDVPLELLPEVPGRVRDLARIDRVSGIAPGACVTAQGGVA